MYVNSAIRITQDGDWLTPKFLGRPFFLKPPLLIWLAALSIRTFGLSLLAVRLPSLIFGAAGATAVFIWIARWRSTAAGLFGSAVLVMSPLWQTFSRLCYTDMLAGACSALALTAIALDPPVEKRATAVWFGVFAGAALLSKSVAGLLPVAALFVFLAVTRTRPKLRRVLEMTLAALTVAVPWPIYQASVHPRWLWAEGVQFQVLRVGLKGMPTGEFHHSGFFYLDRLLRMDPLLALVGGIGLVGFFWKQKGRTDMRGETLALCWSAVTVAALLAYQGKNLPYIVFLLPGLVILGATCGPELRQRPAPWILAGLLLGIFAIKTLAVDRLWSLQPGAPVVAGAEAMRAYYNLQRDAELIVVQPDDEFYSATIPLKRVRYALVDPTGITVRTVPFYAPLGIVLTTREFLMLPSLMSGYRQVLQEWGLPSTEPVGSMIVMNAPVELQDLVQSRPQSDFYVPADWVPGLKNAQSTHWLIPFSSHRVFLLSRSARARNEATRLPVPW
jgi:4-amino-4-deoxy-L-arabinose transferase-like glycosyltransferase